MQLRETARRLASAYINDNLDRFDQIVAQLERQPAANALVAHASEHVDDLATTRRSIN